MALTTYIVAVLVIFHMAYPDLTTIFQKNPLSPTISSTEDSVSNNNLNNISHTYFKFKCLYLLKLLSKFEGNKAKL